MIATRPLSGGQIGTVDLLALAGGDRAVLKTSPGGQLRIEAAMLEHLRAHSAMPVPQVLHAESDLLLLQYLPGSSHHSEAAASELAELLADLHERPAPHFGFPYHTLLGPYPQDNSPSHDWGDFFRERRLEPMTEIAAASGNLPPAQRERLQRLGERVPALLAHAPRPALVHGDLWAANVLSEDARVRGVLDPALSWSDPEIDLAYIELFDSFGPGFMVRYRQQRPLAEGYPRRRDLYQLYPLLVHLALFGEGYLPALGERLRRLGV